MVNHSQTTTQSSFSFIPTVLLGVVLTFGLSGCFIFDDDDDEEVVVPTVSLTAATIVEGNSGSVDLDFTITSSVAIDRIITLTYSTSDGTATAGSDYSETSGSIDIPAGSTTVTISVPVLGDTDFEADEIFTLTLSAATAATLGTASVIGTITNDDADPKGYYDSGTAAVKLTDNTTDLEISDLQGMVSGNRFMLISVSEVLLYDGTMNITGDTFTATVNIYKDGVLLPDTATVSGAITTASSLTGVLTGVGAGNGTFSLTYSLNNEPSDLSRIDRIEGWSGPLNGASFEPVTTFISESGEISRNGDFFSVTPAIAGCGIDAGSTVLPISGLNIYNVTITFSTCTDSAADGNYTGFATTQSVADEVLVLAYSNDSFSASGILIFD